MKRQPLQLCTALGVFVAACFVLTAAAQSKSAPADVTIDNFSFSPAELKVPVGATVTWTNHDDIPHTVVSTDKVFKSKVMDTNEQYSFTFASAGTFTYFCSIHPKMLAKVIVE